MAAVLLVQILSAAAVSAAERGSVQKQQRLPPYTAVFSAIVISNCFAMPVR
jgi:hypothetical protein